MNKLKNKAGRILSITLVIVIFVGGIYFLTMDPHRGTVKKFDGSSPLAQVLTKQDAIEDLRYFYTHLKGRHPAWLDGSAELTEAVDAQYQAELTSLGDTVTVLELWQSASRIAAQLRDGHTGVNWKDPDTVLYIDNFKQISDYGAPLTINGRPTGELFEKYLTLSANELLFYSKAKFNNNVILSEAMLSLIGVDTSDGVEMTFQTESGQQTFHYEFVPFDRVVRYVTAEADDQWVEYVIDLENSLGIFTLRSCRDDEEYQAVLDAFFEEVFANAISNVVVDLRGNGGGNSRVANEFLQYINVDNYHSWDSAVRYGWLLKRNKNIVVSNQKQPETFNGDLFVLTDMFTYSAAMDFAMLIGDNNLGVLVGEPSGNLPDSYGDILYFQMPNSGLAFSVSFKAWERIDKTKSGEPLMPDYVVPADEALDKVLELIRN